MSFRLDADGHLLYSEQVFAAPKKSGKTGFAALHGLTTILLFGGHFAEGYCLANDFEQASSRQRGPGYTSDRRQLRRNASALRGLPSIGEDEFATSATQ